MTGFGQPSVVYRLPLNETIWQRMPSKIDITALALLPDGQLYVGTPTGQVRRLE